VTSPASPGLQRIAAFTLTTGDLAATTAAYVRWLGYSLEDAGRVPASLAAAWGAPAVAGRRWAWLHPPGPPSVALRFVEQDPIAGAALLGHGWNAVEILVEDPYALARSFDGSPFRVVVAPRPLPFDSALHAMQVIGPAGELLYFTSLPRDRTLLDLSAATQRVDRPFIAILGAPDVGATLRFYGDRLGTPTIAPAPVNVRIINDSFGLGADAKVPMGIVKMPRDYLIEVDELPAHALPRARRSGELPQGVALVSFVYAGEPGVVVGAAGEWIELLAPN
jgi:hypothetical protein